MTNEAVKVELTNSSGFPRAFNCASGVAISKGAFLTLSDPRTAAANTTSRAVMAGFALMDKEADDYSTTISAWTDGVFKVYASYGIEIGHPLMAAAGNAVQEANDDASGAAVMGHALETATDGQTFQMRLKL